MDLSKVVSKFMTETFSDVYAPYSSFKGRILPFNEVTNSGEASRRRILETAPNIAIPLSKVVTGNGDKYIIGYKNFDSWKDSVIRAKYPMYPVSNTSNIGSIYQIITNTVPTTYYYGYPSFNKNISIELQESDLHNAFSFYFPNNTTVVRKNVIIKYGSSEYYKVRDIPFVDNAGFLVARCILLDNPIQILTFTSSEGYDPVTDTISTPTTESNISCFVEESYLSYDNTSERFQSIEPGDKAITFKSSTTPKVGDKIGSYRILSIEVRDTAYYCHCRG